MDRLVAEGFTRNQAVSRDYEQNWAGKQQTFRTLTAGVTKQVSLEVGEIKTNGFWKLSVMCVPDDSELAVCCDSAGVLSVPVAFDPEPLLLADDEEVRRTGLTLMRIGVDLAQRATGEDLSGILSACESVGTQEPNRPWRYASCASRAGDTAYVEVLFGTLSHDVWMAICDGSGSVLNRTLVARLSPLTFDLRRQCLGSLAWDGDEIAVLTAKSGLTFRLHKHGDDSLDGETSPGIMIKGAGTSPDVSSRICAATSYVCEMAARAVHAELDLLGCSLEIACGRDARPSAVLEEGLLRVEVAFDARELLRLSSQKRGAVSTGILRIAAIELSDVLPALSEALQMACEDIEEGGCRYRWALLSSESPDGRRAELICSYTTSICTIEVVVSDTSGAALAASPVFCLAAGARIPPREFFGAFEWMGRESLYLGARTGFGFKMNLR
ncbi:hypothetical protein VJ923_04395 [Adlercreutzia sp. R25]|uniref:hypothetical protein n=1 Tax=Adlercreutzia shanghongiae TaxID=3111773 RepID=UPI002DB96510|nr:hypothetical protein [Adlercreutzia sp. R25]MEC4272401.1 hypothetical protein [Adlercreutzia sp. R25]